MFDVGAHASHVGDVVLGAEVRTVDLRLRTPQRPLDADRGLDAGEHVQMAQVGAASAATT